MPLLHFHVDNHDVGYMPDPDNVVTFVAIDDAIDYVLTRAEEWLDYVTEGELPRGVNPTGRIHTRMPMRSKTWTARSKRFRKSFVRTKSSLSR
jgi:predicted RNase H-like HicB family nuclease